MSEIKCLWNIYPKKKKEVKLFANDLILYRETLKMTSKNIVRTSKFNKVSGYKFNLQKSVVFQCIQNKLAVREIKETIPFTAASKRI